MKRILLLLPAMTYTEAFGQPSPAAGFRWEFVDSLSDEFSGSELDDKNGATNARLVGLATRKTYAFIGECVRRVAGSLVSRGTS